MDSSKEYISFLIARLLQIHKEIDLSIQLNRKWKIVQFQGEKLKNALYLALH